MSKVKKTSNGGKTLLCLTSLTIFPLFLVNGAIVTLKTKIFANGLSIHLRQDFLSIGKELTDYHLRNKTSKALNTITRSKIKVSHNEIHFEIKLL